MAAPSPLPRPRVFVPLVPYAQRPPRSPSPERADPIGFRYLRQLDKIRGNDESSTPVPQFEFCMKDFGDRNNARLFPFIVTALMEQTSPICIFIWGRRLPTDLNEELVLGPCMNLVGTHNHLCELVLADISDAAFLGRLLTSATNNDSLNNINVETGEISIRALTQLFNNEMGLKTLKVEAKIVGPVDAALHQAVTDASARNSTIEDLHLDVTGITGVDGNGPAIIKAVLDGLSKGSNVKKLLVVSPILPNLQSLTYTIQGVMARGVTLTQLDLWNFSFPDADSFRPIVQGVNRCPTMTKISFASDCSFGLGAANLISELNAACLGLCAVDLDPQLDLGQFVRSIVCSEEKSAIKKLCLKGTEFRSELFEQLAQDNCDLESLEVDLHSEDSKLFYLLIEHLPAMASLKNLSIDFCGELTPAAIDLLLKALKRNNSIGCLKANGVSDADFQKKIGYYTTRNEFLPLLTRRDLDAMLDIFPRMLKERTEPEDGLSIVFEALRMSGKWFKAWEGSFPKQT